jgi:Enhancer of polycomb-like
VEYDLDNEDEDWLRSYNLGRSRLSDVTFELMLHRLEVECAAATDNALAAAGVLLLSCSACY